MAAPEPLLDAAEARTNLFPIRYPRVWDRYKQALAAFWVAGEVDLSRDRDDWAKLTADERHFVSMVLAFFANADGVVNDNLSERFGREVAVREAKCFYDLQKTMENVHNEMYSLLIQTYVDDAARRDELLHAVDHFPCVARKAAWARRWIDSPDATFAERLVAFAVVEGIFFSGSFCAIFWLKQRGLMPGLCQSNTLIARDEGMHQDFAALLYTEHVRARLADATAHALVGDAVAHEKEFICGSLPVSLIGMNADDMARYVEFVADRLLAQLGHPPLYGAANPFEFMALQGLETKTNFFEGRESAYQKVGARADGAHHTFAVDADF
jgi:ribonucleotide reductase beta subunit family protein with ferritin-like domain